MAEKEILKKAFTQLKQGKNIFLPPGDDCAAIKIGEGRLLIATADQLIEGVHYKKNTAPAKIAKKLLNRNLSDIAACGGAKSLFAICTIALGKNCFQGKSSEKFFEEFFRYLGKESAKCGVSVCGGDIAKIANAPVAVFSMTILGETSEKTLCRRSGAKAGDILFCTGEFGNSFDSGHHLAFVPRLEEAEFISNKYSRTMIDVSDGLLIDAERLAEASRLGIVISPDRIPLRNGASLKSALTEGEDYELLFAVPANKSEELIRNWEFNTKLTKIGYFKKLKSSKIVDNEGEDLIAKFGKGYDHFKNPKRKN
ncbi:MAG TPA: thiamine-phosphate kinase [Victivallales bacterium]|nr:thiamine-phosphate kinase [Victivallales bacterium]